MALATPVPVLSVSDGTSEFLAALDGDEPLTYSYRQSIYQVPVYEELAHVGTGLRIERVRSPDVRSVEYFGWKGEPAQERAPLARERILLLGMREREEAPDGMGRVERGLAEAAVELAAPCACDVRHHRVEGGAPLFVLVEGEIQEMP